MQRRHHNITSFLQGPNTSTNSSTTSIMPGLATLVNYKTFQPITAENTRSHKRIHVQDSTSVTATATSGGGKRWSFNSTSRINDLLTDEMGVKPLSPPKRRKTRQSIGSKDDACLFRDVHKSHGLSDYSSSLNNVDEPQQGSSSLRNRRSGGHPLIFDTECDAVKVMGKNLSVYYPTVTPFHDSFHRFRRRRSEKVLNLEAPDHFATLPDEMILPILKWLPKPALANIAQTNKRFARLIEDDSLWKKIDGLGKVLDSGHLGIIINRKPIYLRLARTLINDPPDLAEDLDAVARESQLLFLDLSMSELSTETLAILMRVSTKLTKLSLEHLSVPKEVIVEMMSFSRSIDTLNITMCYDLEANVLAAFFMKCSKLKMLNISCIKCEWTEEDLERIVKSLPCGLEQLNIAGFRSIMKDHHVKIIASRCKGLIDLDLSDCQELTGKSIEYISTSLPELQHLGLSRCYAIEPATYGMLTNMKCLRYLELFSLFKESSIKTLETSLPGIEINNFPFSAIARPTVGAKRSSIWLLRVRD